jgi:hypothetical protein
MQKKHLVAALAYEGLSTFEFGCGVELFSRAQEAVQGTDCRDSRDQTPQSALWVPSHRPANFARLRPGYLFRCESVLLKSLGDGRHGCPQNFTIGVPQHRDDR